MAVGQQNYAEVRLRVTAAAVPIGVRRLSQTTVALALAHHLANLHPSSLTPDNHLVSAPPTAVKPLEMGLLLLTPTRVCSRPAMFRARVTSTITLLRSLAGPGGGFDTPNVKCPPDRGSSDRVRDGPAPYIAAPESYPATRYGSPAPASIYPHSIPVKLNDKNTTPRVAPIGIPRNVQNTKQQPVPDSSTPPPLTPDSSYDSLHEQLPNTQQKHNDALEILATLFPNDAARALPYAKRVTISSPEMPTALEGVVLALPGQPRTLYVDVKGAALVNLRENIVALLDLADECFDCQALIIALEKASPALSSVLHALMYAGGAVVTKPFFKADPALVLVGLEI
ncbi:unnamed protein product [Peniophora sp. CBMAI 1063]|nr:unnamed protein product [Peniophora sp. CBMAI 1063]